MDLFSQEFEWNSDKRGSNIEKYGIDFLDAIQIFAAPHFREDRTREEDEETRKGAVGPLSADIAPENWSGHLIVVMFTRREGAIRMISARRADTDERKRYDDHFGGSSPEGEQN
jgi:uncharacterized DUF497 family protein